MLKLMLKVADSQDRLVPFVTVLLEPYLKLETITDQY